MVSWYILLCPHWLYSHILAPVCHDSFQSCVPVHEPKSRQHREGYPSDPKTQDSQNHLYDFIYSKQNKHKSFQREIPLRITSVQTSPSPHTHVLFSQKTVAVVSHGR